MLPIMTGPRSSMSTQHVIIAYGPRLDYHHGAKYQILSAYSKWLSRPEAEITVVTDNPDLYAGYPCKIIPIAEKEKTDWTLGGAQHFGIKIGGFSKAMRATTASNSILLDTDMIWIRDPSILSKRIGYSRFVMYRDEGPIYGSNNKSIQRFSEGLDGKTITIAANKTYTLSHQSRMWASNILGLPSNAWPLIDEALELFKALEPEVSAHTVEQFSISETLRFNNISKISGKQFLDDWSSTGRKNYVGPVLSNFFQKYGENNFDAHMDRWHAIQISRPIPIWLKQKLLKKY